jgi:hypothetical protein
VMRPQLSSIAVETKSLAVLLLLGGTVLNTGASVSLAQSEGPSAIRVESREVVVPVFVVDKSNVQKVEMPWQFGSSHYQEWDKEITGLSAKDFHVLEDGVEQQIQNVAVELPRVWEVRDNVSHHIESSCTPRGIWSSPDLSPQMHLGSTLWLVHVYLVSYAPPPSSPEGSCHRIKVKVDHRNATVYARDEYCKTKNELCDQVDGTKLGTRMENFANEGKDGRFPVSVQVSSFFGTSDANRVDVATKFPSNALNREWNDVKMAATIVVLGLVYDKKGALAARFSDIACHPSIFGDAYRGQIPLPISTRKEYEYQVIPSGYETQTDLFPGEYDLKLVVTDGEKFGRAEVPLRVDRFDRENLAISGVVLCKRYHMVPDGSAEETRPPQYVPLISNGLEFTPAGETRFNKSDRLMTYFEIYEPRLERAGEVKLQFQMKVTDSKTGEVKAETGLRPVASGSRPGNPVIPVGEEIAIDKLPPGAYRLEVQASDSAGKSTVWRAASFTVE